jgi:hypothetical protein
MVFVMPKSKRMRSSGENMNLRDSVALDHDEFGSDRSKLMKRDRFKKFRAGLARKAGSTFSYPALAVLICLWSNLMAVAADGAVVDRDQSPVLSNPLAGRALENLSATLARPLFVPTRRGKSNEPAPVVRVEAPVAPPAPPPAVALLGIVKSDETARAMLRMGGTSKTIHVQIGDQVGGWTVTEIADRSLILSSDTRRAIVGLFKGLEPRTPIRPDPKKKWAQH